MNDEKEIEDIQHDIDEDIFLTKALSFLFGEDIVEQARLLDAADLNLTDEMTVSIGAGVKQLKQLKQDPDAQRQWIIKQPSGVQLLLCLWIMDMDLLDKIRN